MCTERRAPRQKPHQRGFNAHRGRGGHRRDRRGTGRRAAGGERQRARQCRPRVQSQMLAVAQQYMKRFSSSPGRRKPEQRRRRLCARHLTTTYSTYHGYGGSVCAVDGTAIAALTGYTVIISVAPGTLGGVAAARKITVTVTRGGQSLTLTGWRTTMRRERLRPGRRRVPAAASRSSNWWSRSSSSRHGGGADGVLPAGLRGLPCHAQPRRPGGTGRPCTHAHAGRRARRGAQFDSHTGRELHRDAAHRQRWSYRRAADTVNDSAPGCSPGATCSAPLDPTPGDHGLRRADAADPVPATGDFVVVDNQNPATCTPRSKPRRHHCRGTPTPPMACTASRDHTAFPAGYDGGASSSCRRRSAPSSTSAAAQTARWTPMRRQGQAGPPVQLRLQRRLSCHLPDDDRRRGAGHAGAVLAASSTNPTKGQRSRTVSFRCSSTWRVAAKRASLVFGAPVVNTP